MSTKVQSDWLLLEDMFENFGCAVTLCNHDLPKGVAYSVFDLRKLHFVVQLLEESKLVT